MAKFISIGKILNFHGIKGEVKVGCSKSQLDFFSQLKSVYIKNGSEYEEMEIKSIRQNKNVMIVKFAQYNSINEVIPLKGQILFVEESTVRESLDEDEFLIDELVGLEVFDKETDKKLGFVVGVSNNGASDLISVKTNSQKICLIPFVKAIVPDVSIKDKKIMINNIEGLLE